MFTFVSTSETSPAGLPPKSAGLISLCCNGAVIASPCEVRRGLIGRSVGLIGRRSLDGGAMLIARCRAIHTFLMRFPIDVVFVDGDLTVVGLLENVQPWRSPRRVRGARHAIELPAGAVSADRIGMGDQISFVGLDD